MKEKKERTKMIERAVLKSLKEDVYYGYWVDLAKFLNMTPQMLNKVKNRILKKIKKKGQKNG